MYTGYLFIIAFAILVTNAVCDDKIDVTVDGGITSMSTDKLCTTAGLVKNTAKTTTTTKQPPTQTTPKNGPTKAAASKKMSTGNIVLIVLGVTAGGLILAFVGMHFYNKQKVN